MILFPLDCWTCFVWWWFPLGPLPVQPRVATVLHVVLVPSWNTPCSSLGCCSASCGVYSLLDHSLFSLGLLGCFVWCLFHLRPLPFQHLVTGTALFGAYFLFDESLFSLGSLAVLHVVLIPSLTSCCSALGHW
jgi:hypothetical protein